MLRCLAEPGRVAGILADALVAAHADASQAGAARARAPVHQPGTAAPLSGARAGMEAAG
jgi:hypothetical protein